MSDTEDAKLVEELRDQATALAPGVMQSTVERRIEWQAAATIERLREELQTCEDAFKAVEAQRNDALERAESARAAAFRDAAEVAREHAAGARALADRCPLGSPDNTLHNYTAGEIDIVMRAITAKAEETDNV